MSINGKYIITNLEYIARFKRPKTNMCSIVYTYVTLSINTSAIVNRNLTSQSRRS